MIESGAGKRTGGNRADRKVQMATSSFSLLVIADDDTGQAVSSLA
jgi:hypothetical protein